MRLQVCSVVQSSAPPGARVTGARARLLNGGHRDSAAHRVPALRLAAPAARRPLARSGTVTILAVAAAQAPDGCSLSVLLKWARALLRFRRVMVRGCLCVVGPVGWALPSTSQQAQRPPHWHSVAVDPDRSLRDFNTSPNFGTEKPQLNLTPEREARRTPATGVRRPLSEVYSH